ncbi:MAG: tyrosine--tRNA ligase [Candidatus Doudnabacteria bacterium]|nr:tyrosine--tRNA ligase [Candidatus Doudnabacteria bacterium]
MADLTSLKQVTEEILGEEKLSSMLDGGEQLKHYIGFEISGILHLGSGLMTGLVIRELQKLGVDTRIFLADWHTWINNKLGGDHELIKRVALEYFMPAMKVSCEIAGADPEKIAPIFGSELYHNNDRYWQSLVEVSKNLTLSRVMKSTTILGRQESENMNFALLIYPPMQVADIFEMGNHIAHAGMDQRKCHVIALEVAEKLKINPLRDGAGNIMKPIAIHHHLVMGLQKPATAPDESMDKVELTTAMKMSKSVPGSAVFIHDTPEEIQDKIRKAYAPEKETKFNPILDWTQHLLFPIIGEVVIEREERFGGNVTFKSYPELEAAYASGDLFPLDLKNAVAKHLIDILAPARERFSDKDSQELIALVKQATGR